MASSIDQNELNRTIDSALEDLWVKLIEDNKFVTGAELYRAINSNGYQTGGLFMQWCIERGFRREDTVGDWK